MDHRYTKQALGAIGVVATPPLFFKEKYDSGGALKFVRSLITRVLRVVARNGFRCFTPVLTDNINLTLKLKNASNPFW